MRVFSSRPLTRCVALLLAGSAVFLAIEFLDELTAGFPVVSLPLLRDGLHLIYQQVGLLLSSGPLSSALLEPVILLMSDRWSKLWLLRGALLCMAGGWALAAAAPSFWWLLLAVALEAPAIGAALGLGQAALIENFSSGAGARGSEAAKSAGTRFWTARATNGSENAETQFPQAVQAEGPQAPAAEGAARAMTRWTITGALGDLASPLAVTVLLVLGLGWRQLYWAAAGIWFVMLLIVWFQRFPRQQEFPGAALQKTSDEENSAEPSAGLLAGLRAALSDPTLLRWAVAEKLCTMVDEIFLGFAALYLRDTRHASASAISLALALGLMGGLVGLLALDRLLKYHAGVRLLPWLALLALAGVVGFLAAPVLWLAAVALFLFNLSAAGFYPITKAAAYSRWPGRTGTVQAVIALGEPFEIVLPVVVGFLAGQFGVLAAVGFLGLAPLGIVLLAPRQAKKPA